MEIAKATTPHPTQFTKLLKRKKKKTDRKQSTTKSRDAGRCVCWLPILKCSELGGFTLSIWRRNGPANDAVRISSYFVRVILTSNR